MDEGVEFQSNALDVVGSWLLGGHVDKENDEMEEKEMQPTERQRVTLYRPSSSSAPSLTRPNAAANADVMLTEQERKIKLKLLRKTRGNRVEEAAVAEQEAQKLQDEVQDEEEQELVRCKTQKNDKKRKRTVQDELMDRLRDDAAKKKAKNLKRKLQLQRKKQQHRELNHVATAS